MTMKSIGAAEFKAHCLKILDRLEPEGLVITKHGRPVARLLPFERHSSELIGSLRHKLSIRGDVFSTGERWSAGDESAEP